MANTKRHLRYRKLTDTEIEAITTAEANEAAQRAAKAERDALHAQIAADNAAIAVALEQLMGSKSQLAHIAEDTAELRRVLEKALRQERATDDEHNHS